MFQQPELLRMGHSQTAEDSNLGLGWLYYALGRIVRPRHAVVIGSLRGFVPLVIGKALQDNAEPGQVTFIDPGMVDSFWSDSGEVRRYFESQGVANIRHFRMTSQEFVTTQEYGELKDVGLLFVDGYHTEDQARFDFEAFEKLLDHRSFALFHDSMVVRPDKVYGEANAYEMRVKYFVDHLKSDPDLQVMDLPFGVSGLTVVRKINKHAPDPMRDWIEGRP